MTLYKAKAYESFQELIPLDAKDPESFSFSLLNLENTEWQLRTECKETALLLLEGKASARFHGEKIDFEREHWKKTNPSVFHLSCEETLHVKSEGRARFALIQTQNEQNFPSRFYPASDVSTEHRGQGLLDDMCYRHVKTVFDHSTAPKEAQLVLGEVLNFSGRWSSYPPHHHEQQEIYYYEFDPHQGFGFGQCGEEVHRVQHQNLLFIEGGKDHAQVCAPGYSMYYLWVIRHRKEKTYTGFEYTKPYDAVLQR